MCTGALLQLTRMRLVLGTELAHRAADDRRAHARPATGSRRAAAVQSSPAGRFRTDSARRGGSGTRLVWFSPAGRCLAPLDLERLALPGCRLD